MASAKGSGSAEWGLRGQSSVFFLYDHSVSRREEDDPKDAIVYFAPSTVSLDQQVIFCGHLMGMVSCLTVLSNSKPKTFKMKNFKVAVKHEDHFTLALIGSCRDMDQALHEKLDKLYATLVFYHGSLASIARRVESREEFVRLMADIWNCYLPHLEHYGECLEAIFDPVPTITLPKGHGSSSCLFLKASRLLQSCQRRSAGVLAGSIFYRNRVLCTQITSDLLPMLCLLKPGQRHHPCLSQATDFELPEGVRILLVFLAERVYADYAGLQARRPNHPQTLGQGPHQGLPADCGSWASSSLPSSGASEDETLAKREAAARPAGQDALPHHKMAAANGGTPRRPLTRSDGGAGEAARKRLELNGSSVDSTDGGSPSSEPSRRESGEGLWSSLTSSASSGEQLPPEGAEQLTEVTPLAPPLHPGGDCRRLSPAGTALINKVLGQDLDSSMATDDSSVLEESSDDSAVPATIPCLRPSPTPKTPTLDSSVLEESSDDSVAPATIPCLQPSPAPVTPTVDGPGVGGERARCDSCDGCAIAGSGDGGRRLVNGAVAENRREEAESLSEQEQPTYALCRELVATVVTDLLRHQEEVERPPGNHGDGGGCQCPSGDMQKSLKVEDDHDQKEPTEQTINGVVCEPANDGTANQNGVGLEPANDGADNRGGGDSEPANHFEGAGCKPAIPNEADCELANQSKASGTPANQSGADCEPASDGALVPVSLYVQGHSEMLALFLIEKSAATQESTIHALWKLALPILGELEIELREQLGHVEKQSFEMVSKYNYLQFNHLDKTISGNCLSPISNLDYYLCQSAQLIHQQFAESGTLSDVLLRNHLGPVYGKQTVNGEVYFQSKGGVQAKHSGRGAPSQGGDKDNQTEVTEVKAQDRLLRDHHLILL